MKVLTMKNYKPPVIAKFILSFFLNHSHPEEMLGDYNEIYMDIYKRKGFVIARLWYCLQIIIAIPPYFKNSIYWSSVMFKNYLKIACRNLLRQKTYSAINITGLSIGITSFLFIMLYILYNLSYDNFHKNSDSIYRIATVGKIAGSTIEVATVPAPMGPKLAEDFPEEGVPGPKPGSRMMGVPLRSWQCRLPRSH